MTRKILILLLWTIITLTGCLNNQKKLPEAQMQSETVKNIWGDERQKELKKIVSFTDSIITNRYTNKDINEAYHLYLDSIYRQVLKGNRRAIGLGITEEEKIKFLKKINKKTYTEIWMIKQNSNQISKKDIRKRSINNQGLLSDYIKRLSHENKYYNSLYTGLVYSGGISPAFLSGYITNHRKFDFNKFDNRLILAIILFNMYEIERH